MTIAEAHAKGEHMGALALAKANRNSPECHHNNSMGMHQ